VRVAIIALFWNQPATGSGQYVRRLAAHLAEEAPDLDLLLVAPRGVSVHKPPAGADVCATSVDVRSGLGKLAFEQRAFGRAAVAQGAHVLHVPYFAPPRYSAVPSVVTIHDIIPLLLPRYRGNPLVRAYTAWVAHAARQGALVLTDSHAAARDIRTHLGIPDERLRVIHLAADACYHPAPRAEDPELDSLAERLGLPERYLLYLGGFDRRKRVPELLQAYGESGLANQLPLVIAGRLPGSDTAFHPDPRSVVRTLSMEECVIFTGWVEESDKPALYRGARAFVFPSSYEGFGLPVLEALACGTPVIACRGSSLDEVAGSGGLLVQEASSGALAEAMRSLALDDALRDSLAAAGLAHARAFSWAATARATAQAYGEALDG